MNEENKKDEKIIFYELNFEGSCFESRWEEEFNKLDEFIDSSLKKSLGDDVYNKVISGYYDKHEVSSQPDNDKTHYHGLKSLSSKLFKRTGSKTREVENEFKGLEYSQTVIFVQNKSISEFDSQTRYDEIRTSLRREEFLKFLRLEHMISKLSISSGIRWVYVLNADCIGPFFSFVLGCDKILSFDTTIKVGFEVKEGGYLPSLGGRPDKENLIQNIVENYQPVFTSYFAYKKHIFDYCGKFADWRNNVEAFIDTDILTSKPNIMINVKELESIKRNTDKKFLKFCGLYGIPNIFDEEQVSSYSFYNEHIRNKFKSMSPLMRLVISAYLNARQMYSFGYSSFLDEKIGFSRYSLENENMYNNEGALKENLTVNKKVYIDLDQILPPLEPMLNLIKSGYSLIFFSASSSTLSSLMDLFFLRLTNQELDLDVEKSVVLSRLFWFVGRLRYKDGFILKWISNEEVVLSYKDQKQYVFNTLYKKDSVYLPNWCEFEVDSVEHPEQCLDQSINELITTMIKPPIFAKTVDRLSLSVFIKSWFLEKLIKYSVKAELDIMDLVSILEEFGWGVVSSDICWDKFMISRQERIMATGIDVYKDKIAIGEEELDREILAMNVWKEVYMYSPKVSRKQKLSRVDINIYFVNLARYMKNLIYKSGYVASSYLAGQLVRECLGIDESSRYYLKKSGMYLAKLV